MRGLIAVNRMKNLLLAISMLFLACTVAGAQDWQSDSIWHDGLVEKAVYAASRIVYGRPRAYEAIFFTNKELHDAATLTKADKSSNTIEVWKHNQIEDIPTPNYHYHYETTSHLTTDKLALTRLDCSSQEFCGTSFKQFELRPGQSKLSFFLFSYMPETGRTEGLIDPGQGLVIPADALPLRLREFDLVAGQPLKFWIIDSQKSNRQTSPDIIPAEARDIGEENGTRKIEVYKADQLLGTYWMASDRQHVMTKYAGADGQSYELKSVQRVNYWKIKGE